MKEAQFSVCCCSAKAIVLALNIFFIKKAPGKFFDTLENQRRPYRRTHEEIEDFYQWMIPTVEEHHARLSVVDRVRKSVKEIYPHARVEIFGSFRTGLYLPTR